MLLSGACCLAWCARAGKLAGAPGAYTLEVEASGGMIRAPPAPPQASLARRAGEETPSLVGDAPMPKTPLAGARADVGGAPRLTGLAGTVAELAWDVREDVGTAEAETAEGATRQSLLKRDGGPPGTPRALLDHLGSGTRPGPADAPDRLTWLVSCLLVFALVVFCLALCLGERWVPLGLDTSFKKAIFCLYVSLSICWMTASRYIVDTGPHILVLILASSVLKAVVSLLLWMALDGTAADLVRTAGAHGGLMVGYALLALTYLLADYLRIDIIQKTNPSTYDVLVNLRVITTVMLWELMMGKRLACQQWLAILTICCGCLVKELPSIENSSGHGASRWLVYVEMICCILCGSVGAVVNELFLKHHAPAPLNLQNLALYLFTVLAVLCAALGSEPTGHARVPLLEWSQWSLFAKPAVLVQVVALSGAGLVTSHFLRQLSNVTKEVAIAFELLVLVPLDTMLFGARLGVFEVGGAGVTILGVIIFVFSPSEADAAAAPPAPGGAPAADAAAGAKGGVGAAADDGSTYEGSSRDELSSHDGSN